MKSKVLIALALALLIVIVKVLFFDIVTISKYSMLPTFFPGDYVLISKTKQAKRGDIIVFRGPGVDGELYIKRVVAVDKDKVVYKDDHVYLNENELSQKPIQIHKKLPDSVSKRSFRSFTERNQETSYQILVDQNKITRATQEHQVHEGEYFVLGDNRNHSRDSRDFGVVNFNQVVGTAIYW